MNDRELLEMAAKACGWRVVTRREFGGINVDVGGGSTIVKWNPLTDDGDALRLAVKLGIDVTYKAFGEDEVMVSASEDQFDGWFTSPYGDDKTAATRRAIVRAAAEMVKP